jgi:coatomer subunit beta'
MVLGVVCGCRARVFKSCFDCEECCVSGGWETGIDDAFELEQEISEKIRTGRFVGDCFIYNTSNNRLNYFVGGQVMTLAHLDRPMYVLGYLQKENRVYLTDKQHNVVSYQLLLSVLIYQAAIVRRDMELGT